MDLKACDRCGAQFRHLVSGDVPYPQTGAELPKLETGIRRLNKLILPLVGKNKGTDNPSKEFHSFPEIDLCAKCDLEFEPVVAKWLAEGAHTSK